MKKNSLIQVGITANIFEWYQFCIAAFLAPTIGHLFFNTTDTFYATLQGFGLFAMSYLFRPLGSVVFGLIGDKKGTARSLQLSLVTMTLPSVLIGLLPTFSSIGYIATFSLIILRFIQGFGSGGELPISAAYLYQNSEKSRYHTVYCSLVTVSSLSGVLVASFVIFMLHAFFTPAMIDAWGWRIPFLIGIPMSLLILRIRSNINDAPILSKPLSEPLPQKTKSLFKFVHAISLVACEQVGFYTLFIWLPIFLINQHRFDPSHIRAANNISLFVLILSTLGSAYVCSRFNYRSMLKISSLMIGISTVPLFILLNITAHIAVVYLTFILFGLTVGSLAGVMIIALSGIFKGKRLSSGTAISFTLGSVIFGGTAPVVCTYFTHMLNLNYFGAIYLSFFAFLFLAIESLARSKQAQTDFLAHNAQPDT